MKKLKGTIELRDRPQDRLRINLLFFILAIDAIFESVTKSTFISRIVWICTLRELGTGQFITFGALVKSAKLSDIIGRSLNINDTIRKSPQISAYLDTLSTEGLRILINNGGFDARL